MSLLHANKPTRVWDDATKDFSIKKVYHWASTDTRGKLQTPHDRMQPAFFGTYTTVAVPFISRVIAQLPREHRLVTQSDLCNVYFYYFLCPCAREPTIGHQE